MDVMLLCAIRVVDFRLRWSLLFRDGPLVVLVSHTHSFHLAFFPFSPPFFDLLVIFPVISCVFRVLALARWIFFLDFDVCRFLFVVSDWLARREKGGIGNVNASCIPFVLLVQLRCSSKFAQGFREWICDEV